MKARNPCFGCQRIAEQISQTFGIVIDKDVVRRVLAKYYRAGSPGPSGPSWLTFFAQAKDSLWSVDLFRSESIRRRSHWVLVVMDVFTRRIIGFGVAGEYIDGQAVCRMFNQAIAGHGRPRAARANIWTTRFFGIRSIFTASSKTSAPITTALVSTAPSRAPRPQNVPETPHHRKRTWLTMPGNGIAMDYSKLLSPLDW